MPNDTVTLSRQEYDDLVDGRDAALAMRDVQSGAMALLTEAELDDYLAASSPLQFWRKHRGLTQTRLGEITGITQPHLAQAERGQRGLSVQHYAKIATALRVRIEDLLPIEPDAS